ncbi:MAG: hypothetical protein RR346_06300 [Bacteroidales bacterium]
MNREFTYLTTPAILPEADIRILRPINGIRYALSFGYSLTQTLNNGAGAANYHTLSLRMGVYF